MKVRTRTQALTFLSDTQHELSSSIMGCILQPLYVYKIIGIYIISGNNEQFVMKTIQQ